MTNFLNFYYLLPRDSYTQIVDILRKRAYKKDKKLIKKTKLIFVKDFFPPISSVNLNTYSVCRCIVIQKKIKILKMWKRNYFYFIVRKFFLGKIDDGKAFINIIFLSVKCHLNLFLITRT